jgi:hypothetical protein
MCRRRKEVICKIPSIQLKTEKKNKRGKEKRMVTINNNVGGISPNILAIIVHQSYENRKRLIMQILTKRKVT